jgi:hypothetical protein
MVVRHSADPEENVSSQRTAFCDAWVIKIAAAVPLHADARHHRL